MYPFLNMHPCTDTYTARQNNTPFELIEEYESKLITKIAKEASINAIKYTLSQGRPVTTMQGGSVIRKYPDGRIEVVRKTGRVPIVAKKRIYSL